MNQGTFKQITIIGLGLIGSSIARAAEQYKLAKTIVGCDHSDIALSYGTSHEFLNSVTTDAAKSVQGSDLVILAVPPLALEVTARAIGPALLPSAIVVDVASVKRAAVEAIAPHMPQGVTYIPAHPIAGSEQSGIAAGRADLFSGKRIIVTPPRRNRPTR